MKLLGEFTFLKMERGQTKENKKDFLIVNLLDEDLNSCRFFVFDEIVMKKLLNKTPSSYKKLNCCIDVSFYKDNWNVALADVDVNG